jgi:hypothetical protein
VRGDGVQHGGFIKFKVGRQRHAVERQPLQLRTHRVHHETRNRREDGSARHVAGHCQQGDQLVRAIAQHDVEAFGHARIGGQRFAQVVHPGIRVAVQRESAQALAQFNLQRVRQRIGVLHRIELDHADRVLDRIGVHRLHVLADPLHQLGADCCHLFSRIGGTWVSRNSAARAWACRPSP